MIRLIIMGCLFILGCLVMGSIAYLVGSILDSVILTYSLSFIGGGAWGYVFAAYSTEDYND